MVKHRRGDDDIELVVIQEPRQVRDLSLGVVDDVVGAEGRPRQPEPRQVVLAGRMDRPGAELVQRKGGHPVVGPNVEDWEPSRSRSDRHRNRGVIRRHLGRVDPRARATRPEHHLVEEALRLQASRSSASGIRCSGSSAKDDTVIGVLTLSERRGSTACVRRRAPTHSEPSVGGRSSSARSGPTSTSCRRGSLQGPA